MKKPLKFITAAPWCIEEQGLHSEHSEVAESLFSLANESMGVRAYFEEGYSGKTLPGNYFNGAYEKEAIRYPKAFPGNPTHTTSVANATDWLACKVWADNEPLDLAKVTFRDFRRVLDFRTGLLSRRFVWMVLHGELEVTFERILSMAEPQYGAQRVTVRCLKGNADLVVRTGLKGDPVHRSAGKCFWKTVKASAKADRATLTCRVHNSGIGLSSTSLLRINTNIKSPVSKLEEAPFVGQEIKAGLARGETLCFERVVCHAVDRSAHLSDTKLIKQAQAGLELHASRKFDDWVESNRNYWSGVWENSDIVIEGDPETQQGIRFCIFQLFQTYTGHNAEFNIGAKGLSGEVYWGGAWWDTETYCLPFYLFNNPKAALHLLLWRHRMLPGALERAQDHGCRGARYPMCTVDGSETCVEWQHGDLEIHVSAAVAYGIWHYWHNAVGDAFLFAEGIEMLIEISRFYASRASHSPRTGEFGFWGVMGADEFHMMINNNAYTNVMAKKAIEFTLQTIDRLQRDNPTRWQSLCKDRGVLAEELQDWARKAEGMRTNFDAKTGLYEQHDGYFDLPHIDLTSLSAKDFPLYASWPYINLFRYDMIKQPDVLLLMFLFSGDYNQRIKSVNFDYYEPRCSHESSLSPGIHAILAAELGRTELARFYSAHATRLDLDNYNRNTHEGLHITSMAGAWLNIVYGWAGFRSDDEILRLAPRIPEGWDSYSFRLYYHGSWIEVCVDRQGGHLRVVSGSSQLIHVCGEDVLVGSEQVQFSLADPHRKTVDR